ncbi:MAG: GntR family transcriptional regulator [Rhodospirillales bacterium]|nr:GntR family transcriptional regulator [Rhodospirillales bacterium]MDH3911458.1 GntR family transcriptional regulator [Rhodospirillales bacterium]MDH3966947.1 GntR family transcriptional regulator [Rhodospirillales bacterium]
MNDPAKKSPSRAESLYLTVKDMAISFKFKPGERINEVDLARRLGASRTPLREALNRLVAEGFIVLKQDRGFFCRDLKPREMFELYQFRAVVEVAAVRLACEQATEQEVADLARFLDETGPEEGGRSSEELVALDEYFHEKIMALSRNIEMCRTLENINARIRYFRWVDMDSKREETQNEHRAIVQALMVRDADLAAHHMNAHIARRLDQITAAIKESYSRIYLVN